MSCKTLNNIDGLPDIYFPEFPISTRDPSISFSADKDDIIIEWEKTSRTARIPIDIWEDFVEYAVDVNTAKKKYQELQEVYGVQK